ncbi:GntR family transcriptional regulator [Prauserella marina]|uniref:GntR family transcriptional regulator / MocR family aminotransferase n=1 Tax=Prauserella marina TaxID=530584 RepID=A0A222VQ78_9PSEU|nr:PLP-dependent aminotransferase family protein [Prauserella marina]ASR36002.1 GntR family transcriptional regulator [Prauserella marina]PWV84052.1 GntR family transcriptional regulator/MocR family aminotransferase [Prauserella marina]SDC31620.1 GntR family transcriptional regulator / MocR family aminotransferase [Prauserella marina]
MAGADFLQLDPGQSPRNGRTAWLAERLRIAVADGTLGPGTRLPATRVLADELAMARGTVVEAYRRLAEEGLLVTNRGGGTIVADPVTGPPALRESPVSRPGAVDISSGMPDLTAFPRAAWLKAERSVLSSATQRELGYTDPRGAGKLREALAGWLGRSRGVAADPGRIIVTAGVAGALSLLAQVLRRHGVTTWAVEDPGADGNRRVLGHWLDHLVPVPVDGHGLDVSALAESGERAVLVTPAHQFPTGVVLSPFRRRELLAWAERAGGVVIEDDYDAEYRYDRAPVRALQATAPDRVAHVSSLSKVLAPALRLGWLIAPPALHDDLVHLRWATDLGSPTLPQLALAQLIETGSLERHLRTLRRRHQARRDAAVAAIRRYLPGCAVEGVAAGLHLVVRLPARLDDTDIAARALEAGIAVHPLSHHRFAPGPPGLVIGYGPHPAPRLERAIATLGTIVSAE